MAHDQEHIDTLKLELHHTEIQKVRLTIERELVLISEETFSGPQKAHDKYDDKTDEIDVLNILIADLEGQILAAGG